MTDADRIRADRRRRELEHAIAELESAAELLELEAERPPYWLDLVAANIDTARRIVEGALEAAR